LCVPSARHVFGTASLASSALSASAELLVYLYEKKKAIFIYFFSVALNVLFYLVSRSVVTGCVGGRNAPAPCKLTFDLLNLKAVSESRVTWATSVAILVFLCLSVFDLGPMYATDRRQADVRQTNVRGASSLKASALWRMGIISHSDLWFAEKF